jgi:hypothetical protein
MENEICDSILKAASCSIGSWLRLVYGFSSLLYACIAISCALASSRLNAVRSGEAVKPQTLTFRSKKTFSICSALHVGRR